MDLVVDRGRPPRRRRAQDGGQEVRRGPAPVRPPAERLQARRAGGRAGRRRAPVPGHHEDQGPGRPDRRRRPGRRRTRRTSSAPPVGVLRAIDAGVDVPGPRVAVPDVPVRPRLPGSVVVKAVSVSAELTIIQRAVEGAALLVEIGRQGGVEDEDSRGARLGDPRSRRRAVCGTSVARHAGLSTPRCSGRLTTPLWTTRRGGCRAVPRLARERGEEETVTAVRVCANPRRPSFTSQCHMTVARGPPRWPLRCATLGWNVQKAALVLLLIAGGAVGPRRSPAGAAAFAEFMVGGERPGERAASPTSRARLIPMGYMH